METRGLSYENEDIHENKHEIRVVRKTETALLNAVHHVQPKTIWRSLIEDSVYVRKTN